MVDWYSVIEPRRAAEVSLTPGGLEGVPVADALDSPPAEGQEETWLQAQLNRLRELGKQAADKLGQVKGAAKTRVESALGQIGRSASAAKKAALDKIPTRKDIAEQFQGIVNWVNKLTLASKIGEALLLVGLLWGAHEFLGSRYGRALF